MNFLKGFTTNFCQALFAESDIKPKRLVGKVENVREDSPPPGEKKETKEANILAVENEKKDLDKKRSATEDAFPGDKAFLEIQKTFDELNQTLTALAKSGDELTVDKAKQFAEQKNEAIQKLSQKLETQKRGEVLNDVVKPVKLPPEKIKGRWMDEIATDYGMTVDELKDLNVRLSNQYKTSFHLTNYKNKGRFYCDETDDIYVPKTNWDKEEEKTKKIIETERAESGVQSAPEAYNAEIKQKEIQSQASDKKIAEDINQHNEKLTDRSARLPDFLSTGLFHGEINKADTWAEVLTRTLRDQNNDANRVINVIGERFHWTPVQFREVIRRGANNSLSFRNLTQEKYGVGPKKFFTDYEAARAEKNSHKKEIGEFDRKIDAEKGDIDALFTGELKNLISEKYRPDQAEAILAPYRQKPEESYKEWNDRIKDLAEKLPTKYEKEVLVPKLTRALSPILPLEAQKKELEAKQAAAVDQCAEKESFMASCTELFNAMDAMQKGVELKGSSAHEKLTAEKTEAKIVALPNSTYIESLYDFSSVVAGKPKAVVGGEAVEPIGIGRATIVPVQNVFQELGVSNSKVRKMDGAFVLKLMADMYGMDLLIRQGNIAKPSSTDKRLYLASLPTDFNKENKALQKIAESVKVNQEDATLTFNEEAAFATRLSAMAKKPDLYNKELLSSAFSSIDEDSNVTSAQIDDGKALIYKKTGLLSRRMDPQAAMERILDKHTTINPDTAIATIDYTPIQGELQNYLDQGIAKSFMDPNLNIVEALQNTRGVNITNAHANAILTAQEDILLLAKEGEKELRTFEKAEKKGEKEDAEASHKALDEIYKKITAKKLAIKDILEKQPTPENNYISQLQKQLKLEDGKALTLRQKRFIQNGYAIEGEKGTLVKGVERKQAILESYKEDKVIYPILVQLMEADKNGVLSGSDLEDAAILIHKALENDITWMSQQQLQDKLTAQKTPKTPEEISLAVAGQAMLTHKGKFDGMRLGGGVSVPLPKGFSVQLGIGAGVSDSKGLEAGGGIGLSKAVQAADWLVLTTTVSVGAGVSSNGLNAGATVSETGIADAGKVIFYAGASTGVGFSESGLTLGWGVHGGGKYDVREHIQDVRRRGGVAALKTEIDSKAKTVEEKAALIAQIPEFRSIATDPKFTLAPKNVQAAILNDMFNTYASEMQNASEADAGVFPLTGIHVVMIGPIPLPLISFAFRGRAKVYPMTKNGGSWAELSAESHQDAEKALRQQLGAFGGAEIATPLNAGDFIKLTPIELAYNEAGQLGVLPQKSESIVKAGDIANQRLGALDKEMKKSGMELTPVNSGDAAGLLKLSIHNVQGDVQVIMDPSMKNTALIGGKNPSEIYLAANTLYGDLIIQRQEFNLTRKPNTEWTHYRKTVITIKANPRAGRNFNTFNREGAGSIEFRDDSKLSVDSRGIKGGKILENRPQGMVLTMEQFKANRDAILAQTGVSKEILEADLVATEAVIGKATAESRDALETTRLSDFAKGFFNTNRPLCYKATTETPDMGENNKPLIDKLNASYKARYKKEATPLEVSFILGVVRRETFLKIPANEKPAFARRHREFFQKTLTAELGDAGAASRILANMNIGDLDLNRTYSLKTNATLSTVVGRDLIKGMRRNVIQGTDAKLVSFVDYTQDQEMRALLLQNDWEKIKNAEADPFLHTPLALNVYQNYLWLKGPEAKKAMDEIHANPSLAKTGTEIQKATYRDFNIIVKQFHAAQLSIKPDQQTVMISNYRGESMAFTFDTKVVVGANQDCANPTIYIEPNLSPVPVSGATKTSIQERSDYMVHVPVLEIFAGGTATTLAPEKQKLEGGDPSIENNETPGGDPEPAPSNPDPGTHGNNPGHP
ncbi:MAG: hypothetical protein WC882_05780 [Candidatus Gracilibacteria bacterium]